MMIAGVDVRGLTDLPRFEARSLERVVRARGPTPATTALGDAIELAFAACHRPTFERLLARWDLLGPDEKPEIVGDPLPTQATWMDRVGARALVADPTARTIEVRVEVRLDPIQFGELRALSAREPRLVAALGEGATASFKVGALFATSFDAVALDVLAFEVGGESFPTAGPERPAWLAHFLAGLGTRFARHTPGTHLAERVLDAQDSRDRHDAFRTWQKSLRSRFGDVRAARGPGGRAVLLADDLPLRRFGNAGAEAAGLAATCFLSGAEIVWAETSDPWIDGRVEGPGSPLEQVWRIDPAGSFKVVAQEEKGEAGEAARTLTFQGPREA